MGLQSNLSSLLSHKACRGLAGEVLSLQGPTGSVPQEGVLDRFNLKLVQPWFVAP